MADPLEEAHDSDHKRSNEDSNRLKLSRLHRSGLSGRD